MEEEEVRATVTFESIPSRCANCIVVVTLCGGPAEMAINLALNLNTIVKRHFSCGRRCVHVPFVCSSFDVKIQRVSAFIKHLGLL